MAENDSRWTFNYTCAANANYATKLNSLAASPGGNIKVAPAHDVVAALGNLLPAPAADS